MKRLKNFDTEQPPNLMSISSSALNGAIPRERFESVVEVEPKEEDRVSGKRSENGATIDRGSRNYRTKSKIGNIRMAMSGFWEFQTPCRLETQKKTPE